MLSISRAIFHTFVTGTSLAFATLTSTTKSVYYYFPLRLRCAPTAIETHATQKSEIPMRAAAAQTKVSVLLRWGWWRWWCRCIGESRVIRAQNAHSFVSIFGLEMHGICKTQSVLCVRCVAVNERKFTFGKTLIFGKKTDKLKAKAQKMKIVRVCACVCVWCKVQCLEDAQNERCW